VTVLAYELGVHNSRVILMKALAILLVASCSTLFAHENNGRGVKAVALADAFVAVADNPWAVYYNPAGLVQLRSPQACVFYVPQQFGIPLLNTKALAGGWNMNPCVIGAFVEQFGFDLYQTTDVAIGVGIVAGAGISAGATVNVERVAIERYGASTNETVGVGLLGRPFDNVAIAFALRNLTATTIGVNRERLPQCLLFGLCFTPFEDFRLVSEMEKDLQFPLVIKAGIEQKVLGFLSFRCGVANNPDKFSAGIAIQYSSIEFGYAGYSHPDLGWTHQIELAIQWDTAD